MQNKALRKVLISSCLVGIALTTGCAKQQDYDSLQQRVQTQDQQLRQLQPGMADTWSQMQALRQELNTIKGQLDDLNSAGGARMLVERVNRHDAALRQVETNLALDLNLDAPMTSVGAPMEGAYGAPTSTGFAPVVQPPMPPQQSVAALPQDLAQDMFNAGISAFNSRQYAEAIQSFNSYIETYPSNPQVGNAWFYVGEGNFQLNKFSDAALAYDKVITAYPKSSRAAAAYLKQGICFSKLGQKAAATARLQELIKKFPNSAEATRARAFLKTNG